MKRNQVFGTFDLVTVLALAGTAIAISATIVQDAFRDDSRERAQLGAETLAHQMLAGGFTAVQPEEEANRPETGSRGPASVASDTTALGLIEGSMGRDPWGSPFHYKLLKAADGRVVSVMVWSEGPNQKQDTQVGDFEVFVTTKIQKAPFRGDDVGFIYKRP